MTFITSLSLAILLAGTAFSTPIEDLASSSSSSGTSRSQNPFKPFFLESFKTQYLDSRQYMMFMVRDQNFSPRSFGMCMAMVPGAGGEQYGPETKEERSWRPVPGNAKEGRTASGYTDYSVGYPIDENGWIECGDDYSFKTEGDVAVGANKTIQFNLSIKQKLDEQNTDGQFNGGEMIFTDDVTVSCNAIASGSQTYVCLPTGDSSFTFGTYDFNKSENNVSEDAETDEIEDAGEGMIEDTNEDTTKDMIENIFDDEDETEVEDDAEVELELEAQA